ncbi:hypothetical protein PG999_008487 [Apiospora kogelbergensis]|uniref:Uncharacterized protein n=1 Tax=Apiospora kogelbergensis TaxID=1337665 RepID=A0AAW0QRX1_9PEZI
MYSSGEPAGESMLTTHRSSANNNDAVYGSKWGHEASPSKPHHNSSGHSGHHGSSKRSIKAKHKSKKGHKSTKSEAGKKQQQAEDLAGVGSQFDNDDYQYAMADDGTYDDDINLSPDYATGA